MKKLIVLLIMLCCLCSWSLADYYGSRNIGEVMIFTALTKDDANPNEIVDADAVPIYLIYENETATRVAYGSMAKLNDANTVGWYSEAVTLSAANGYEAGKSYNVYITYATNSVVQGLQHNFQILAPVTSPAGPTIRHVGSGQVYSTIAAAVSAASSGDTILIHPGSYDEAVDLSAKPNITLRGHGVGSIIHKNQANPVITLGSGCRVENISIASEQASQSGGQKAIYAVDANDIVIDSVHITSNCMGIYIADCEGLVIKNCYILSKEIGVSVNITNDSITAAPVRIDNSYIMCSEYLTCQAWPLIFTGRPVLVTNTYIFGSSTGGDAGHRTYAVVSNNEGVQHNNVFDNCVIGTKSTDGSHETAIMTLSDNMLLNNCQVFTTATDVNSYTLFGYPLEWYGGKYTVNNVMYDSSRTGDAVIINYAASTIADTNELQQDWVNAGRLDTILDSILTDTGTTLDGIVDNIYADTHTTIPAGIAGIDGNNITNVDAVIRAMDANSIRLKRAASPSN